MALFPVEPPSLQTLVRRVADDLRTRLGTAASLLGHTAEAALAAAIAGVAHPLWRALDRAARISLWATTLDETYLPIWAALFGVYRKSPTHATGKITASGVDATLIPEGTLWERTVDGALYKTLADAYIDGVDQFIDVQAVEAGLLGNYEVAGELTLVEAITDIDALAYVNGPDGLTGGSDQETLANFAVRFFDRLRFPPGGGKKGDYRRWAKEISYVTRCWEYPKEPVFGYVTIRCVKDFEDADTEVLSPSEITEVGEYIGERMPLGIELVVADDVVIVELDPEIKLRPNSTAVQNAATKALRLALSKGSIGTGTISLSLLNQALLDEVLIEAHEITDPLGNIPVGALEVVTLGTPIYTLLP